MPDAAAIVHFADDSPPPGLSPWVDGAVPKTAVEIAEPDPEWPRRYDELADRVRSALGWQVLVIEHIGSTSVPGLAAKPIIDIDLTVAEPDDEATYVPALEAAGFRLAVREPWWYRHRAFRATDPACNLHVFGPDSPETWRHRLFRDWLRGNPEDRDRYAAAKREAAEQSNARNETVMDYTARKQAVIREIYGLAFAAAGLTS